jgi:hypothetical protein
MNARFIQHCSYHRSRLSGSGNIFGDLGLSKSKQELLKAKLTVQIHKLIKEQNLTPTPNQGRRASKARPGPGLGLDAPLVIWLATAAKNGAVPTVFSNIGASPALDF